MSFNIKKCMVMHYGQKNQQNDYYMDGEKLKATREEKDIGVLESDTLKPGAQCAKAAQTASTVLSQLSRAFHLRERHTFIRLYKQYVLPHLEFAIQAWSPWLQKDKETLEKVQRRAVGMVSGLKGRTYEERLEELDMTTLEERRHQLDMFQTFKIIGGHDAVEKQHWFSMATNSTVSTKQVTGLLNLLKPRANLEVRGNFFSARVVDEWNAIPSEIKMAKNPAQFKGLYKAYRRSQERP